MSIETQSEKKGDPVRRSFNICTEINEIKRVYFERYATLLEEDLENMNPTLGKFLRTILLKGRSESDAIDHKMAEQDAEDLIPTKTTQLNVTNGTAFSSLLCLRSKSQIALTLDVYRRKTGVDLETSIRKEFHGETQFGVIAF
uniref:Uncharacterized protein n=1 Tax=Romanomermis culicivorax TaxID=13658 RepID=A0A915JPD8_ROMCU